MHNDCKVVYWVDYQQVLVNPVECGDKKTGSLTGTTHTGPTWSFCAVCDSVLNWSILAQCSLLQITPKTYTTDLNKMIINGIKSLKIRDFQSGFVAKQLVLTLG